MIVVFSDGATERNGKANAVGGIGVWFGDGHPRNISKGYANGPNFKVTNQTMELLAAVSALRACGGAKGVRLVTDSMYTIQCATKWYKGWMRNGWKTASGKPVLNRSLIETLVELSLKTEARFEHVNSHRPAPPRDSPAHAIWYGNHMADALAVRGMRAVQPSPSVGPPKKITQWFFSQANASKQA